MLRYTYIACLVHIETRGTYTYHGVLNVNKIASSTDYCYSTFKFLENHQTVWATDIIDAATLTEGFRAFSPVVRQMPG